MAVPARAMKPGWPRLRLAAPGVIVVLLLLPLFAGAVGVLLPAFGYLPALGGEELTLAPWRMLFSAPGLGRAVQLSLQTGLLSTLLSLLIVVLLLAGRRRRAALERLATPLVAVPHVALAVGLAFLIAPSGWLFRLLSPWATGWERPPDLLVLQDPQGLALLLGLVVKETPFLLLVALAALPRIEAERRLAVATSLGQSPVAGWFKVVLPALYPQLRLPLYAVLAFALSNVEMALVLGPTTPPTLAVLLLRWLTDPDLALRFPASAGALLQTALIAAAIALWRLAEVLVARLGRRWIAAGGRRAPHHWITGLGSGGFLALAALGGAALVSLVFWSFAETWRFPAALPEAWTLAGWERHGAALSRSLWITAAVAGLATALALFLTVAALEGEAAGNRPPGRPAITLVYLPLVLPQIAFLFGAATLASGLGLVGGWLALVWAHLLFVLPYVFLTLAESWRRLDPRYVTAARALGLSRLAVLWRIKLPLLKAPLATAAAVGIAVSVALYLPTLFLGGGRFVTLTTEAVALASGGDRRLLALYALLQAALPLAAFAAAAEFGRPRRFRRRSAAS